MPMIDVYATAGTFADQHQLAADLAAAVMTIEQVPDIPMFRRNTAAFVHDLADGSLSNVDGRGNSVRIQVLTNAGALDRGKQLAVVERLTDIAANAAGDPTLSSRTWVLLTEAPDGGWGLAGHANTNEELVAAARAQMASLQTGQPAPVKPGGGMTSYSHATAPTRFAEVEGALIAYRSFGIDKGTPILLLNHYRAGMDHWDPLVTDGLAQGRRVILYDYRGVAGSSGDPRDTFEVMGQDVAAFVRVLGLPEVDVLGFSIGGMIGLDLIRTNPELVRRLIVADAKPRAGDTEGTDPRARTVADNPVPVKEDFLFLFFAPSETSQQAGQAFWQRRHKRTEDMDPPSSEATMRAQRAAVVEWSKTKGERYAELAAITQPTLVVHGRYDIMQPPINAYTLAQRIPRAQLVIYPDSGHGAIFQYPGLFADHAARFLDAEPAFT